MMNWKTHVKKKLMFHRLLVVTTFLLGSFALNASRAAESGFHVAPEQIELSGLLDYFQIQASVLADKKIVRDLTHEVSYTSLTPAILEVNAEGLVRPLRTGQGKIQVTHGKDKRVIDVVVKSRASGKNVSFVKDVVPVLNKGGCSLGGCHASQFGKGGFKLSLFGFAPEQDYPAIARDDRQRRVSILQPKESLILQKASMGMAHGGGRRFAKDSYEYHILETWIAEAVTEIDDKEPKVVGMQLTPMSRRYKKGDIQQLRVIAEYSDGSKQDVTALAQYDSLIENIATVTPRGKIEIKGPGQTAIMVRFMGQAKISTVISPYKDKVNLADFKPNNFIDEQIKQRYAELGLEPSPLCSDEVFIRRAFMDCIGTLPTPEKVKAFLASKDPNKRSYLIDELLGLTGDPERDVYVEAWSANWGMKWGDLLRINRNKIGDGGMWAFSNWVRQSLRENKPVNEFVSEIITAQGSIYKNGPANYFKIASKPEDLAEATSQIFLGVRLQCAKCHHHPFEVYSQKDYYSLAAFFTRVGNKSSVEFGALGQDTIIKVKNSGSIRHPRTRKTMEPTPLMGEPVESSEFRDLRRPLARWITSPENELFSKNIVNRFWSYYMGTGFVEPIDDMRETNPASNPELLNALSDHFVKSGYDLKELMRVIMNSRAYQLASEPLPENVAKTRFYTHYNVKRLSAEVMLDALDDITGSQERFRGVPEGTRAIELPDPNYNSYFLDTLGRPKRVITCECERTSQPNLAQVLQVANGQLINTKLAAKTGRIEKLIKAKAADHDVFTEMYLTAFSRYPTKEELAKCDQIVKASKDKREGYQDVLWAISNSREFLFNH
ncbi:Bacterial Ig-like domain (group 2) [Gimesia panareensis]|uniref:Bacterial Ig-like domain (Group 2) n=2 Tax=Gimesia panareensis TaxID=2527978 RepID=A0A517QG31_9PLAN|nr:Bacterial Ig-like domain (group 2) [Gimesia panareensis]